MKKDAKNKEKEVKKTEVEQNKENEYLDGWKRCQADFENYKKMQMESQREFVKYAAENLVLQIIPVLDNFHMSTDHVPEDQKNNAWVTGIMHIQKQLENVLKENGATEIETKEGDQFNPEIHEALENNNQETKNKEQKNKISKVILKGYKLNGKIIRAVKVVVE